MYFSIVLTNLAAELSQATAELSTELLSASLRFLLQILISLNTFQTNTLEKVDKIRIKTFLQGNSIITQFIGIHGTDFTLLQSLFPHKTRKQLKKKYQEVHKNERWV